MSRFAQVVIDRRTGPGLQAFTYSVPPEMEGEVAEGMRVVVPFGKQEVTGYVLGLAEVSDHPSPRPIKAIADEPSLLLPHQVELSRWVAAYYRAPLNDVVRAMIPPGVRAIKMGSKRPRGPKVRSRVRGLAAGDGPAVARKALTQEQEIAAAAVAEAIASGGHRRLLLHGVTGSGKTEVYLDAIERCLAAGRGVIVLIPEVSLTAQVTGRFAERFAGNIAVLHSRLTPAEKAHEWRRLRSGEAMVAIGPRAAIFAPVQSPGLIIVDEEHSVTYKQLNVPRYHAVDVAQELGRLTGAVVLLGSATPSITSYHDHGRGAGAFAGAAILELTERYGGVALPRMELVDMREDGGWGLTRPIGERMRGLMARQLAGGGQVILYLNRRGLAWFARCRRCGESVGCPNCSVSLVYHGTSRRLSCHYCGHGEEMPERCPACQAGELRTVGFGTERIQAEAERLFPGRTVLRLDRDTARTRDSYYGIWEDFAAGRGHILVGTSLVTKGWDLRGVGLVGVIDADQELQYPNFRAAEDTFATLVQAGGRARRAGAEVCIQTMNPHHYAIRLALGHDYHSFFAEEIAVRAALQFPPFFRLVEVTAEASEDERAEALARSYVAALNAGLRGRGVEDVQVLGPSPAFIHRLKGQYRWSVTIRGSDLSQMKDLLPDGRGFAVDVDPL